MAAHPRGCRLSAALDQAGIFKGRLVNWAVKQVESGAVAVTLKLVIVASLDGQAWVPWDPETVEEYTVYGDFWVIKKDGGINTKVVESLVAALPWDGNLTSITQTPPDVVVQVTVKEDTYQGVTRYKASWVQPEDYTPQPMGESSEDVKALQAQFGSLLRAAAGAAKKAAAKPASKKGPPPAKVGAPAPGSAAGEPVPDGDDIPF